MKKIGNTNIKVISKISEYESADTVDIVYDILDHNRAESVKNGVTIGRQKGSRRIIDRNRNAIAHEQVDYSEFKVTQIPTGQTVDNSKKEADLESAAMALLADLGINWDEDEEEIEEETEEVQPEISEQQIVSEPETVESEEEEIETQTVRNEDQTVESDSEEIPDDFDSMIAVIINSDSEAIKIDPADMNWNNNYGYDIRYRKMW